MTDDENKAGAPTRPFASYTTADHARVAMAETFPHGLGRIGRAL